jgi:hypothetical protein
MEISIESGRRLIGRCIGGLGDLRVNKLFPSGSSSKTDGDRRGGVGVARLLCEFGCNVRWGETCDRICEGRPVRGFGQGSRQLGKFLAAHGAGQGVEQIRPFAYAQAAGEELDELWVIPHEIVNLPRRILRREQIVSRSRTLIRRNGIQGHEQTLIARG